MMPWIADSSILIDRFDARSHLDSVSSVVKSQIETQEALLEDRQLNYERFRVLVFNAFLGKS